MLQLHCVYFQLLHLVRALDVRYDIDSGDIDNDVTDGRYLFNDFQKGPSN